MTIPTDNVDKEYLAKPRRWDIVTSPVCHDLARISSIFDYVTFAMMLFLFKAWDKLACSDRVVCGKLFDG